MKYFFFLLIIVHFILGAFASQDKYVSEKGTEEYYFTNFLGQKDIPLYADTFYPRIETNYASAQLYWQEVDFEHSYLDSLSATELDRLNRYLTEAIIPASYCSPSDLGRFQDYMQYLYRLISMSYLFEVMSDNYNKMKPFTAQITCDPASFKKVLERCAPKSIDMKSFMRNLNQMNFMQNNQYTKNNKNKSLQEINLLLQDENNEDVTIERLKLYCQQNKLECTSLTEKELVIFLNKACEQDESLFVKLCNEEDQIYGLTSVPHAYDLILKSNASQVLSRHVDAANCMRRWSDMVSVREVVPYQLPLIFPLVAMNLEREKNQYIQGRLFVAGALREFEEKGLGQIFGSVPTKIEPIKSVSKVEVAKVAAPAIRVDKKITVVDQTPIIEKQIDPPVVAKAEPQPPKKSAFLTAYEDMYKLNRSNNFVDMVKFRYDFIFSFKMLRDLKEPLKVYTSIEALKEMKVHDKLGTADGPVPLTFIKYLIDTNQHHGLYNLISILTDRFYVFNDIDENISKKIYYLSIKNDDSTQLRWQIMTLKE
jgi:hypothetical protein